MVNIKKILMTFGTLVSLALLIHGCGGGGGGGTTNNTPNAAPSAQAAGSASKAVSSALNLAASGLSGSAPSIGSFLKPGTTASSSDASQIRKALEAFKSSVAARQKLRTVTPISTVNCSEGGTVATVTDDNNTPSDILDDKTTTTYTDCAESGALTNGSLEFAFASDGLTFTYTNFITRITVSGSVSEFAFNGGFSFHSTSGSCGMESGTMTDDLTFTSKFDQAGDGTFEVNSSFAVDMTMTLAQAFGESCAEGATTLTINGGTTSTNNVNSENDVVTFTNFEMVLTPDTRVINGVSTPGDTLSLNGTIEISSSCTSSTTFTISTPVGQEPFVPEDGSCPVDGRFIITNGGDTIAVIYTSTGGLQIDEGNNGSIDDTFTTCRDAEGICT